MPDDQVISDPAVSLIDPEVDQVNHRIAWQNRKGELCVPVGSGRRIAIDRDGDNFLDRDELDAGSDPTDPLSIPTP